MCNSADGNDFSAYLYNVKGDKDYRITIGHKKGRVLSIHMYKKGNDVKYVKAFWDFEESCTVRTSALFQQKCVDYKSQIMGVYLFRDTV